MVRVEIPVELLSTGLDRGSVEVEATRLLALELYREDEVSLGRAPNFVTLQSTSSWRHNVPQGLI